MRNLDKLNEKLDQQHSDNQTALAKLNEKFTYQYEKLENKFKNHFSQLQAEFSHVSAQCVALNETHFAENELIIQRKISQDMKKTICLVEMIACVEGQAARLSASENILKLIKPPNAIDNDFQTSNRNPLLSLTEPITKHAKFDFSPAISSMFLPKPNAGPLP